MSQILWNNNTFRKISAAYFNHYVHGFPHPDRIMDEHDLIYMCEGEWEIYLEETPIILRQDQVLILPSGVHHYGLKNCLDGTKTMFIHVSSEKDSYRGDAAASLTTPEKIPLPPLINCAHAHNIKHLFENIVEEFSSGNVYKECRMSSLLQLLLTELYSTLHEGSKEISDVIVKDVLQIIRENPEHFHTLQELSQLLHVSPRTITMHFNKVLGTTPYKYELNMKLNSVSVFMREYPNVKLYEVAKNFGFYDEFHLSKAFTRRFSISPSQYRKMLFKS